MNKFQRKLNKLKRDPKLFISDMFDKHINRFKKQLPIKYKGYNQYTVVSAVYNVARYLDDYFLSLTTQTLDFKQHIQLILVDDGSTDHSAEIIKKWQKKYPENIHYIYKENGGIASARNLGLANVKTKWVTFIDSDDFVHTDYFKIVDDAIYADDSIQLAVGNLKFFFDETQSVQDSHSLNYRFTKEKNIVPVDNLDKNINLFVTVSFFKTDILHENNVIFDDKIKPNFEDGKFLADYFLHTEYGNVAYLQKAVFFYRKRGDGSSTIDGSWLRKEKYYNLFVYGYIPMLESYKQKYGEIPKNIQWTVLYEICWHIKTLLNSNSKLNMLTDEEINEYYQLVRQVISYIDNQHILDFNLIGIWFFYKVGLMGLKHEQVPFNIAYIENVDREKKQILVVYQYTQEHSVSFALNGKDVLPQAQKIVDYHFAKQVFVHEVRAWIPYDNEDEQFTLSIDGNTARLSVFGKQHNGWKVRDILNKYKPSDKYQTDGSWIIMDRDTQADDNGEHFYRYMKHNHPEQKCYFALNKQSHDWERLKNEGFLLLDFGSKEFEAKLRKASKIISSHFDSYISNYFGNEYEHSKKFVFLQHGITKDNMSRWFNYKRNMLGFITATKNEYESIINNNTNYHIGKKETWLTGFARHDQLLKDNQLNSKIILIMPTWRSSILGKATKIGNAREYNQDFMQTTYAQHWLSFLCHSQLKMLAQKYGYQLIFAPHANIEPYLPMFQLPSYIQTWSAATSKMSIQQLFQAATLMVTDYSSVAFEMGFLKKPVLYYQFDRNEFFSGSHIYEVGYFEYEKHGFGAVALREEELLNNLEQVLEHNGKLFEPYATRAENTFPFRDGKNCERIYQAIMAMDKPENSVNPEIALPALKKAIDNQQTNLIVSRYELLAENGFEDEIQIYQETYLQAKCVELESQIEQAWEKKKYQMVIDLMPQQFLSDENKKDHYYSYLITSLRETSQWQELLEIQSKISNQMKLDNVETFILAHYRLGLIDEAYRLIVKPEIGCRYEYWVLIAELAFVYGDTDLESYCYKHMIALFPNKNKASHLASLANLRH